MHCTQGRALHLHTHTHTNIYHITFILQKTHERDWEIKRQRWRKSGKKKKKRSRDSERQMRDK